jgi:hypothetical protein
MRVRSLAALAILCALGLALLSSGCSQNPPPPTVDNTVPKPSVEPTLGVETTITVAQLGKKLQAQGLKVTVDTTKKSGLFLPAKYGPMTVDGAFVQTYRFISRGEAKAAAKTVTEGGFVLDAAPGQPIIVNWTGWPAFFRSGDLIVVFSTAKDKNAQVARDKRVFEALQTILGGPFSGGQSVTPEALLSGHGGSVAASATTGSVASSATTAGSTASSGAVQ